MSVGWSLCIGKNWEKIWPNQQPSLKQYVKFSVQSENQQNQHRLSPSFTFHAKKYKEALRTRLIGTKLLKLKYFVRLKKFAKWKTTLNFSLLWKLPINPTLKKRAIFFVCNRNPPSPKISCFRSLHRLSSNNSENTNHRHLSLTGTSHCNS